MEVAIKQFIQKQRAATICCIDEEGNPYSFNCFFAFCTDEVLLYFKTSERAYHTGLMLQRGRLSGTILPDVLNPLQVQGVQWTGNLLGENDPLTEGSTKQYHRRFPFAMAMQGTVYTIRLDWVKMTDSSKVFAKKLVWRRDAQLVQPL